MSRVLFTLQDGSAGGTEKRVVQVARKLRDRNHEAVVLIPRGGVIGKYLKENEIPFEEIHFVRLKKTKNLFYYPYWLLSIVFVAWSIIKVIRKWRIEVVYTNQISQIQPAIAGKLTGCKVVWHLIDLHNPWMLDALLSPLVVVLSDQVVSSCQTRVDQIRPRSFLSFPKTCILRAPVDTNRFRPGRNNKLQNEYGLPPEAKLIGIACNVNYNKGATYFVKTAAHVLRQRDDVYFFILGGAIPTQMEYFAEVEKLCADLGLGGRLFITGYRDDMPEAMSSLDIFILSSISEACPLVVLEAMAAGLPVVATAVGGVPELITQRQTGILVPPCDPKSISDAVVEILTDDTMRDLLSVNARRWVERECEINIIADNVEKVLQDVASCFVDTAH